MQRGNAGEGVRCLCYWHQEEFLAQKLPPGAVVLDVGCGPALPYKRRSDYFLIGLDPSYQSIRANQDVDLRIYGSATSLPLPNESVDAVLCFYSIHHMVGQSLRANREIVTGAFGEFGRVLKSGGELFLFEVNPWFPFWLAETLVWNRARRAMGSKLDMYFWSGSSLAELGRKTLGNAHFQRVPFQAPMLSTFPPVFSMPWLQWPRFLYPFDANLFHWRI
jgi:ubiquinone/menaquinone biosynthesis C-methylase UbiE